MNMKNLTHSCINYLLCFNYKLLFYDCQYKICDVITSKKHYFGLKICLNIIF